MSQAEADIAPSALTVLYGKRWANVPGLVQDSWSVTCPSSKSRTFEELYSCPKTIARRFEIKDLVEQINAATPHADT
jgi:hypothetical protein